MSEKFFYEGLVVFDFDPDVGPTIEMPWRHTEGKHEDLTWAVVEEGLGVEPKTTMLRSTVIEARARITVEFL